MGGSTSTVDSFILDGRLVSRVMVLLNKVGSELRRDVTLVNFLHEMFGFKLQI